MTNFENFDPDEIKPDMKITIGLPRLVTATDYHEFKANENILREYLNVDIKVTEVGFNDFYYVGLVHLDIRNHNELVEKLTEYYKNETDV